MGYVPTHLYIITGDKRFKDDFDKEQKFTTIGIAISGGLSFLAIIAGIIYALLITGR